MATTKPLSSNYQNSLFLILTVIGIAYLLQIEMGSFNIRLLTSPVNTIVAIALVIICSLGAFFPNNSIVRLLSGIPFTITLLFTFLILGIIMGLTPQKNTAIMGSLLSRAGFSHMTTSWPFVFTYALTLLSLGLLIARRLRSFRSFSLLFYLNHIGLWLLLLAAGVGSAADQRRFVMYPELGQGPEWRVYSSSKDFLELPIAIELNKFSMETYPAKIAIYNAKIDSAIPSSNPAFFQLEAGASEIKIANWDIQVESYIHEAAPDKNDSFRHWPVVGAAPAAKVSVRNIDNGNIKTGWISAGSVKGIAQAYMTLPLDEDHTLIMLTPEPKHFLSDITVYTPDQKPEHVLLTVNNPFTIGPWKLYQQGYDEDSGALSVYSAVELVYDPWIIFIYVGFGLLALGSLGMIWSGRKESKE
ncbi:MAG: cytochrome c biogenesis protein ResB [Saezia sp.]